MATPKTIFGVPLHATGDPEDYLKSRDFMIKNRLREFLITANSSIKRNNREAMTRSGSTTTTIHVPGFLRKKLQLEEPVFFVREDFMNLLGEVGCGISGFSVTMDTGNKEKGEVQNTVHIHIYSTKLMDKFESEDSPGDLGLTFDFLHMPLCGVPNLLINSQLLDHINTVILKRMRELNSF